MSGAVTQTELDLAAEVLDRVGRAAGPGAEAEVRVEHRALALTRFANSYIHQNVAEATTRVRLRLHADGRTASASTTLTDPDGLAGLVERTITAARLSPPDVLWPGLAPAQPLEVAGVVDPEAVDATPATRAALVAAFVEGAGGLLTAGYCRTTHLTGALVNSAGQRVDGATTEVAFDGIARTASADGVARLASPRLAGIDGAVLGARAAAKARAATDPVELPPGRYEVVLEPTAVADVLRSLGAFGFNGRAVAERHSFASVGEAQFDPSVTMVDDVSGWVGLPFDAEGTPKRRLVLVDAGVTRAATHDRRTGGECGTASTGHALTGGYFGPVPLNLSIVASGAAATGPDGTGAGVAGGTGSGAAVTEVDGPAADSAVADLVAGVSRGLLVTDNWYTRVLDPRTLVMTGLTRNGVWLIENGEITTPVRNLRFTQSYPVALGPGAVLGIGTHAVAQPSTYEPSCYLAPALRLAAWNFTGGASG